MQNIEPTIHNFADLESWYVRKLSNVCELVKDVVGVDRWAVKLFTKVTLHFKYCTHTNYGINNEFYGG